MAENKFRYSHDECPVCNQTFRTDDDIVVCPVCGTPHHRECYKQNGACGNFDKHDDNFRWKSASQQEINSENENIINENIANEKASDSVNTPFGNLQDFNLAYKNLIVKPLSMYPPELEEGVSTEDVAVFVQQDATKYIEKFFSIKQGKKRINWAALFFAPYWFFYRKLYKHGVIVMALMLILSFLSFLPPVERFESVSQEYYTELESLQEMDANEETYTQTLNELVAKSQTIVNDNKLGVSIIFGQGLASLALSLYIGFNANTWYYKHTVKKIREIRSTETDTDIVKQRILKTGGYAFGITFLAVLAEKAIILGFELILMALGI